MPFLQWIELPVGFESASVTWGFVPHSDKTSLGFMEIPITLRVGDFNLDGYPDLIAVLGNSLG